MPASMRVIIATLIHTMMGTLPTYMSTLRELNSSSWMTLRASLMSQAAIIRLMVASLTGSLLASLTGSLLASLIG